MRLNPQFAVTRQRRPTRGTCPGDAPVINLSSAAPLLELIYCPDVKQVLACVIHRPIPPETVALCLAFGRGFWTNNEHLATQWDVWAVLSEEFWAAGMFVAGVPKPEGVPFRFV